jgi:hypothetical protein
MISADDWVACSAVHASKEDIKMRMSVCVLATLAVAISTAAVAKDLKQEKKTAVPTAASNRMSDAEMDKVTAGSGYGLNTACCESSNAHVGVGHAHVYAGFGNSTANSVRP